MQINWVSFVLLPTIYASRQLIFLKRKTIASSPNDDSKWKFNGISTDKMRRSTKETNEIFVINCMDFETHVSIQFFLFLFILVIDNNTIECNVRKSQAISQLIIFQIFLFVFASHRKRAIHTQTNEKIMLFFDPSGILWRALEIDLKYWQLCKQSVEWYVCLRCTSNWETNLANAKVLLDCWRCLQKL